MNSVYNWIGQNTHSVFWIMVALAVIIVLLLIASVVSHHRNGSKVTR
jgi:hypothetical protein